MQEPRMNWGVNVGSLRCAVSPSSAPGDAEDGYRQTDEQAGDPDGSDAKLRHQKVDKDKQA